VIACAPGYVHPKRHSSSSEPMRRAHLERARISHALLLTRKTVERHVSNILAKLEVKRRIAPSLRPRWQPPTEVASTERPS
jgi:hypothetical protein